MWRRVLPLLASLAALPTTASAQGLDDLAAPTYVEAEPSVYLLLRLRGDRVNVYYTPGSLDRAANLQTRLDLATRAFKKWTDLKLELKAYVLSREEWRTARYRVPYGLPVRVGRLAMAVPAQGDDATVALWSELLPGALPSLIGQPIRGTPQQAVTMVLADHLTQLLVSEILVDEAALGGDEPWVRGLVTHLAALDFARRHEVARLGDLGVMYALLARNPVQTWSARDYSLDLGLRDWFWFQAQFYLGAQVIVDDEGKGAVKKMQGLARKTGGVLSSERLRRRYDRLDEWYRTSFTTVSMRR